MAEEDKKSVGRPLKYTPNQIKLRCKRYFEEVAQEKWTITGLALFLGFCSRQMMFEYCEKEEFGDSIRTAKLKVEQDVEEDCKKRGNAGDIFRLKNYDWKDKQEVDLKHSGSITLSDLAEE